jgi:hypothetical protein
VRRRRTAAVVALLPLVLLAGCRDPKEPTDGDDPEAVLAQLPGIRAAEIGADDAADDPSQQYVVVDAEPDATAEQVADALRAVAKVEPVRSVLYLGAGNTDLTQPPDAQVSQVDGFADPDASAARLLAGAALEGARVTVDSGHGDVRLSLDGGDATEVASTAAAVVDDDVLAPAAPVSVTATAVSSGQTSAVAVLSSDQPLTDDLVTAWRSVADAGAGLAGDGPVQLVRTMLAGGSSLRFEALLDFGEAHADPGAITPDRYPQVVPLLQAALDVVRHGPSGSVVQLTATSADGLGDPFLVLATGAGGPVVTPDPQGRGWGAVASAYLA